MKMKLLSIALLLPIAAFASNTVTFLGEVSDSTCDVTINGTSGEVSVQLPTVQATDLATATKTAGTTPFKFVVSGCTAGTQANVGMRLVSNATTNSGNLVNIATNPAEQVSVQIIDGKSTTAVDFTKGEYFTDRVALPTASDSLEFPFTAQYYADGKASVGKVESQLQYALSYN